MRVIAGRAKGRRLRGPLGTATRPTSDKVREAVFGMVDSLLDVERAGNGIPWEELVVLDLYAGTGALGIEALSRGAMRADFVEANPAACQIIRENLRLTGLAAAARVTCQTVQQFLRRVGESSYDLVLVDAPYAAPDLMDVIQLLASTRVVRPSGWMVVEHTRRLDLPDVVGHLVLMKKRRYGDTAVSIYGHRADQEISAPASEGISGC